MSFASRVETQGSLVYHTGEIELAKLHGKCPTRDVGVEGRSQKRLAYLDGLRGFGALLVYLVHHQGAAHSLQERAIMENGYGYEGRHSFAALPFARLFFTGGHHGVTTFFVISGYVLSYSPLRSMHAKDTTKFVDTLSSTLLRRFMRLWLPVVATTLLFLLCWHVLGIHTRHQREDNLVAELWKWYKELKSSSFIYTGGIVFNSYNFHLWTIPLEFKGSITIYTALIVLYRVGTNRRIFCQVVLIWYFTYVADGWYCALFMSGMLLCDLDFLSEQGDLPLVFTHFTPASNWIFPFLMLVSLYLGGVPAALGDVGYLQANPGWYWLSFLKPEAMWDGRWWFRGVAAILTVIAVPRIAVLKSFFESTFCQYLGKISYGFYLVHGPVLYIVGDRLYAASGRVVDEHTIHIPDWIDTLSLPSWGPVGLEINYLAPHLILFPLTIWVADLTTRLIDEPSVALCHRLERWLVSQET